MLSSSQEDLLPRKGHYSGGSCSRKKSSPSKDRDVAAEALQSELKTLQVKVLENESIILGLRSELCQKNDQLSFLTDEKLVGEEALESSQKECKQLTSLVKELDENISQLTTALATRTKEHDDAIFAEKREIEVRLIAEAELQKKCKGLESKLKGCQAEKKQLQDYVDNLKEERQENERKLETFVSKLHDKQMDLDMTQKEVEDLKSLVTQLDLTREQLVEKLHSTMGDRQMTENRLIKMEGDLRRLTEETEVKSTEILHLQALLDTLGKERDHIETELQIYLETFSHVKDENKRVAADGLQIKKELQKSEKALQEEHLRLQQAESKVASLKEQLSIEAASKKVLDDRCSAKASELQALTEELTKMTCEQQILKSELRQMALERENFVEELKGMDSKVRFSEQVLHAKEEEEKEMLLSYQKLCDDHQRTKLGLIELDTENRQLRFQLHSLNELHYTTLERVKSLEEDLEKSSIELSNLEREAERLASLLAQQSVLMEDCQQEKSALSAQVGTLRQAAAEWEQKCENITRDRGALEAQNRILTDVLQERAQEIETLASRYRLEQEHVREVEKLLACLRAQEHQWELDSKERETNNALMRERLLSLEEQVKMLQAARNAQNKEMMRLQSQVMYSRMSDDYSRGGSPDNKRHSFGLMQSIDSYMQQQDASTVELDNHNGELLVTDVSKTSLLHKDCMERLQRTEAQSAQQKRDYENLLELLAKVDEERTLLQKKCAELLGRPSSRSLSPASLKGAETGFAEDAQSNCSSTRRGDAQYRLYVAHDTASIGPPLRSHLKYAARAAHYSTTRSTK